MAARSRNGSRVLCADDRHQQGPLRLDGLAGELPDDRTALRLELR